MSESFLSKVTAHRVGAGLLVAFFASIIGVILTIASVRDFLAANILGLVLAFAAIAHICNEKRPAISVTGDEGNGRRILDASIFR